MLTHPPEGHCAKDCDWLVSGGGGAVGLENVGPDDGVFYDAMLVLDPQVGTAFSRFVRSQSHALEFSLPSYTLMYTVMYTLVMQETIDSIDLYTLAHL